MDGLINVLDLLLPKVIERERKSLSDLTIGIVGDANSPWVSNTLQPRGDVDAIAQEVATPDHYVANMDADPKSQGLFGRGSLI